MTDGIFEGVSVVGNEEGVSVVGDEDGMVLGPPLGHVLGISMTLLTYIQISFAWEITIEGVEEGRVEGFSN